MAQRDQPDRSSARVIRHGGSPVLKRLGQLAARSNREMSERSLLAQPDVRQHTEVG